MARRGMNLRLSDDARRGFDNFCTAYGVTLTALVEAIGLEMSRNPSKLAERGEDILTEARRIDFERASRR